MAGPVRRIFFIADSVTARSVIDFSAVSRQARAEILPNAAWALCFSVIQPPCRAANPSIGGPCRRFLPENARLCWASKFLMFHMKFHTIFEPEMML